ncbi:MAG: prepilin peptidase [Chloroflexi bacterium]|nr:prepilin peptidase [Chloroflexota bacterium]
MFTIISAIIGAVVGVGINWLADCFTARYSLQHKFYSRWRAPIVVIVAALAFAFLSVRFGTSTTFFLTAIYTAIFLLVFVTDIEHRLIFNIVMLPSILFAAIASVLLLPRWQLYLLGGVIAFIIVFGIYIFAQLFARLRHLNVAGGVFGQGDVKLATFMGIVVGFPAVVAAILYTIVLGGIGAILFLGYQLVVHRRLALSAAIPYGPFFCIAGWAIMAFQS